MYKTILLVIVILISFTLTGVCAETQEGLTYQVKETCSGYGIGFDSGPSISKIECKYMHFVGTPTTEPVLVMVTKEEPTFQTMMRCFYIYLQGVKHGH